MNFAITRQSHGRRSSGSLPSLTVGLVLAAGIVVGACSQGLESEPLVTEAGDLSLAVALDPDPPRQKGNTLWVIVKNAQGEPIESAELGVRYSMPAMGAMPEMKGTAEVASAGGGRYRAQFDLPMDGTWTLELAVAAGEAAASASYSFIVGIKGLNAIETTYQESVASESATGLGLSAQHYPAPILESLQTALTAYEEVRELLSQDRVERVTSRASRLAVALRSALSGTSDLPAQVSAILEEAARTADSLAEAQDLEAAREAFGEVSRALIPLAAADPRLREGRHVFACPMAKGFNKWMQLSSELENPYMGREMLSCGSPTDWTVAAPTTLTEIEAHVEHAHHGEIAHYTCSMHPAVKRQEPGTCPICSMDLVPVTVEELETGVFGVDAQRRQLVGVRTAVLARQPVKVRIRTVGKIVYDETRLADVSLKFRGWIGKLHVDATGQWVDNGQTLFTLYSPELLSAQEEFLAAMASQSAARQTSAPDRADYLVEAARQRLRLWDLRDWQIEQIAQSGRPLEYIPIVSPVGGYVIEKYVVAGAAVEPGMKLYRIARLDKVWIEAEVYESELPLIEAGQEAEVTLPYLPDKRFHGTVTFLYPYLDNATRTGRVRLELDNEQLELRPDMYANVELEIDRGERLVVPEEAVLYAGPRRLVFLDLGEGRLRPQEIELGVKSGEYYEVLSGLKEGDVVVRSGNFLIAAESRLRSAAEQW